MLMKVNVVKLSGGRTIVMGDSGQSEAENKEEINEVITNMKYSIKAKMVGFYQKEIEIEIED